MSKIQKAVSEIKSIEELANEDRWVNQVHPLVKLCVTILYIGTVVSFSKYNLSGLLVMAVYPVILFIMNDSSVKDALWRMRVVLPLVCVAGIFNPFFDRQAVMTVGQIEITGGVISMLTLMLKGVFTVSASYLLIATTTIEKICCALEICHLPKSLVMQVWLIYRYISVLLAETQRVVQAYELRAPGQKGIHFKVWGSLMGQMLLRSMDRAEVIYESMCLRGFDGVFRLKKEIRFCARDAVYLVLWIVIFAVLRYFAVGQMIGTMF